MVTKKKVETKPVEEPVEAPAETETAEAPAPVEECEACEEKTLADAMGFVEDDDIGMVLSFCCRPMMQAMLGGSGAVTISMDSGALQVGGSDIRWCPFCGRGVYAKSPLIEAETPRE